MREEVNVSVVYNTDENNNNSDKLIIIIRVILGINGLRLQRDDLCKAFSLTMVVW